MSESIDMDSYQNGGGGGGGVREVDFQRLSQNVGTNIQKILQNVASMQRMITQIGTPQDNQQLQSQLHQIQHYTGQLAKDSAKHLKDLNGAVRQGRSGNASGEQRQRRLQFESLQDDFTKALNSFQQVQTQAAQKEKDVLKKARNSGKLAGPSGNLINIDDDGASGGGQSGGMTGQSKTQMLLEEEQNLKELQDRERSVHQLESDIVDMNTIFKDLATMVHEQGEMVDSIEVHVSEAQVRVGEGTSQLRQAEQYKNAARKKKLILAIVGFIILAILIGIIAWQAS